MTRGLIPQEIIDEIAARSNIVEVVNEYVPLKKAGRNFSGLCPFHNEKTPSFTVSPEKQIFHCFGCGVGGNVFSFIMQIDGLSFPEALEKMAQRVGISLPKRELTEAEKKVLQRKERQYRINTAVTEYFHKILVETKWGQPALEYLTKRGIDLETVEKFQLGFSLPQWDDLLNFFTKKGISPLELAEMGLILPKNSNRGYYDRFRNRLMFPIWDERGNVIAFGGRVLDGGEPKYLNSPDTPLFNKGQYVYGLHLAKNSMRSKDLAVIVEGYMDVIACHQYGMTNTVASLGTAFTREQARALMRHTYQVAIAYDADMAGSKATLRGLDILNDYGCQVKVVNLPQGLDPDDYLRKFGLAQFKDLVKNGQSLIEYKLSKAMENVSDSSIIGKTRIVQILLPDLFKIDNAITRESSLKLISKKLGLAETSILSELRKYSQEKQKFPQKRDINLEKRENNIDNEISVTNLNKTQMQLIKILFEHQEFLLEIEEAGGKELFTSLLKKLYQEILEVFKRKGKVNSTDLTSENSKLLAAVIMEDFYVPDLQRAVADYIKTLKINKLDQDYIRKQQELREAEKLGDREKLKELLSHIEWILLEKRSLAP